MKNILRFFHYRRFFQSCGSYLSLALLVICLTGCRNRYTDPPLLPNQIRVKRDMRVEELAYRYNIPVRDLMHVNGLRSPLVKRGQILTLFVQKKAPRVVRQPMIPESIVQEEDVTMLSAGLCTVPDVPVPDAAIPQASQETQDALISLQDGLSQEERVIKDENAPDLEKMWSMPTSGKVVSHFEGQGINRRDGIRIQARDLHVRVVDDGKVIFSGIDAAKNTPLVIVEHADDYITVYRDMKDSVVKNGDKLKKHQSLGTMKKRNGKYDKLYFEVRKNGQPINPLRVISQS